MNPQETIIGQKKAIIERLKKRFDTDNVWKSDDGTTAYLAIGNLWEAIDEEITQTIRQILEAQCTLLEGRKKEPTRHDRCNMDDNFCYDHREIAKDEDLANGATDWNAALTEITASNRELLEKLQS